MLLSHKLTRKKKDWGRERGQEVGGGILSLQTRSRLLLAMNMYYLVKQAWLFPWEGMQLLLATGRHSILIRKKQEAREDIITHPIPNEAH